MFCTMLSASHITHSVSMLFQSDPTDADPITGAFQLFRAWLNTADTGVDIYLRTLRNPQWTWYQH